MLLLLLLAWLTSAAHHAETAAPPLCAQSQVGIVREIQISLQPVVLVASPASCKHILKE
jgi:hypothetical protein